MSDVDWGRFCRVGLIWVCGRGCLEMTAREFEVQLSLS